MAASRQDTVFEIDEDDDEIDELNELNGKKTINPGDFLKITLRNQTINISQITSVNKNSAGIITSISRDSKVTIPGTGPNILSQIADFNRDNNISILVNSSGVYAAPQRPKMGGKRRRTNRKRRRTIRKRRRTIRKRTRKY
jgi:hypothetical protein